MTLESLFDCFLPRIAQATGVASKNGPPPSSLSPSSLSLALAGCSVLQT
jgi:hypothetical protein